MNLYQELCRQFDNTPSKTFLHLEDGCQWTFEELDHCSNMIAYRLTQLGLEAPNRVLTQVSKSPYTIALYLACLRLGLVYVPVNTAYTLNELLYFVEDVQPDLIVFRQDNFTKTKQHIQNNGYAGQVESLSSSGAGTLLAAARPATKPILADRDERDNAVIIYTSGTTGKSKGAMLSNINLLSNAQALVKQWQWCASDVLLHALPIYHVHGLFIAFHCALLGGSAVRFLSRFSTDLVCHHLPKSTVMMGVPTYYTRLLAYEKFDKTLCSGMRLFVSGSAPLLPQTFEAFYQRSGHRMVERYGMSETNVITSNSLGSDRRAGSVGLPLDGVEIKIVDDNDKCVQRGEVGHVLVCGANVFEGYWQKPELKESEFTTEGFFRTGDLGRLETDGQLTLCGRSKDLIISGGLNVYPAEVEGVIDSIAGVRESAVVGVPHPDFGEQVVAFIVPKDEAGLNSGWIAEIESQLKRRVANFKCPKALYLIDALPRNTMGKVQKIRLRQYLLATNNENIESK